jgi:FKBP-type peptidyl-prolyl cis-trans isomerase (trigger factor)
MDSTPINSEFELSLEQEFDIRSFEEQVKNMSVDQARDFLVKLYRHMIAKEAMYKSFLSHKWGFDSSENLT